MPTLSELVADPTFDPDDYRTSSACHGRWLHCKVCGTKFAPHRVCGYCRAQVRKLRGEPPVQITVIGRPRRGRISSQSRASVAEARERYRVIVLDHLESLDDGEWVLISDLAALCGIEGLVSSPTGRRDRCRLRDMLLRMQREGIVSMRMASRGEREESAWRLNQTSNVKG